MLYNSCYETSHKQKKQAIIATSPKTLQRNESPAARVVVLVSIPQQITGTEKSCNCTYLGNSTTESISYVE